MQVCCGRNCGLLVGTAAGRRHRKKVDLRLLHNLNREATQQVGGAPERRTFVASGMAAHLASLLRGASQPASSPSPRSVSSSSPPPPPPQAAGLADADLLDVRYEGESEHVLPYFLAVDQAQKAVVLAIRGARGAALRLLGMMGCSPPPDCAVF